MNPRKVVMWAGLLIFLAGGLSSWRLLHPPLSDAEQIAANVEAIRGALENRNTSGALRYLTKDFAYQGISQREMRLGLVQALSKWRDIQLSITREHITVSGDTAASTGHYSLSYRSEESSATQNQAGDFSLHWQRSKGQWLIQQAEGPASLPE